MEQEWERQMIIIKLIATILLISFFCFCRNLGECGIIPENTYEQRHDMLAHILAWLIIICMGICGIVLVVYMWTH